MEQSIGRCCSRINWVIREFIVIKKYVNTSYHELLHENELKEKFNLLL